jgi:MucR family transcriptional regulator, transcriptional regulator of exopolysaccharide biosynthesis
MKEQVAEIVAAYVRKNPVPASELPGLIAKVDQAFATLGQAPAKPEALTPAVPIRRAVGADAVICLDCGFKAQMLKRHLMGAHSMSVDEYRAKWKLPHDFPMVAKNYAARRSEMAKAIGLGRKLVQRRGRSRKVASE